MIDFFDIEERAEYQQLISELRALGYREHHSAFIGGYISRKITARLTPYNGRFGEGVILHFPCHYSTQYHIGTYYILED